MRKRLIILFSFLLISPTNSAIAASVIASAGETICNQTVGNATGVTAYRLSSMYCVVEFRTVGSTTWTVPNGVTSIEYLVVAGGGGGAGGQASEHGGGGGGAGGVLSGVLNVLPGSIGVTVGDGGAGGTANAAGGNGTNSSLAGTLNAVGGGRGGTYFSPNAANAGGSGGGAGASATSSYLTGQDGTAGQGSKGGNVTVSGTNARHGAGGGGAGNVGGNTTASGGYTISAGSGGIGITSSITGTSNYYGGGGGGGGSSYRGGGATGGASGGSGGGGDGATYTGTSITQPTAGASNTGGGGGGGIGTGGGNATVGAAGGTGIIILRYLLAPAISVAPSISGNITYGETLTATNGSWLYTPTSYTYQWSRAATVGGTYSSITGATSATYNLVSTDIGQFLKVTVTAANSGGSSAATSAATIAIPKTEKDASISIQAGALVFRQSKQITATSTVAGKITFLANGKRIAGCISRRVSSANSYTAVCNYRPSVRGQITISTTFVPDDTSYSGKISTSEKLNVGHRITNR